MKAIILAAGYATRLYPLTINTPKALLPIAGKPMLNYLMDEVATVPEIDEACIITNHRFVRNFEEWAEKTRYDGMKITVIDDGTTDNDNRLGAVGDILYTIEHAGLDDDLLVAASDDFFTFPLNDFVEAFRETGKDTLLGARISDVNLLRRFAVAELSDERRVLSLVEKPSEPKSDVGIYALYLYRRDTLPLIKRYIDEGNNKDAPGHLPEWLCGFRDLRVYLFEGECIDIGTVESYRDVCERFGSAKNC